MTCDGKDTATFKITECSKNTMCYSDYGFMVDFEVMKSSQVNF